MQQQHQIHIVDEQPTTERTHEETDDVQDDVDLEDVEIEPPSRYDDAEEPSWREYDRQTAAFVKALLPALEKDEFLDDRPSVHGARQLEDLRLLDELDTDETDDVDLAILFALPDESLLFVGSDPTAKDTTPLFGFIVEPFAPIPAPETAGDALNLLRPADVRAAFDEGEEPPRQGEWWLLPTRKVPVGTTFTPGVQSRPYGPSPLANHVPREWGMTRPDREFMTDVQERVDELPASITTPPEVIDWIHRQHQKRPTPEHAPSWEDVQDLAGDILVRGTLRHRENDHFIEELGDDWHTAETHNMDVYTADEFDRVVLD